MLRLSRSIVGSRRMNKTILSPTNRRSDSVDILVLDLAIAESATVRVPVLVVMIYSCRSDTDSEPDKSRGASTHAHVPVVWVACERMLHGAMSL